MRGKVARNLRKATEFVPKNKRTYKTFELEGKRKLTAQINSDTGEIKPVMSRGRSFITECVTAERKLYKYAKRKYMNIEHEEVLTPLPDDAELNKLQDEIIAQEAKENKE